MTIFRGLQRRAASRSFSSFVLCCYTAAQLLGQRRDQHEKSSSTSPEGQGLPCKSHEPAPLSTRDRGDSGLTGPWQLSCLGQAMGTACPMLLLSLGREQQPQGCAGQHAGLKGRAEPGHGSRVDLSALQRAAGARPWQAHVL